MYNFNHDESKMKLQIFHEQYFVNEKKKTVTVKARVQVILPEDITRVIDSNMLPNGFVNNSDEFFGCIGNPIEMTHTAKCANDDVFDPEKGKKIAMAMLEAKAYESMSVRLSNWMDRYRDWSFRLLDVSSEFINKALMAANHDRKYVNRIS